MQRGIYAATAVLMALAGCETKQPEPAKTKAAPLPPAAPPMMPQIAPLSPIGRAAPFGSGKPIELSKETKKQYHVERCYFGVVSSLFARDGYWDSLGSDDPSPIRIPSFGEYPEHQGRRKVFTAGRLPFERHVRSCAAAKRLKEPPYEQLDPALNELHDFMAPLLRLLTEACRYYGRDEYQRDKFKRGVEMHEKLWDQLGELDDRLATLTAAIEKWRGTLKPTTEKLDRGGELSANALRKARQLVMLLLAKKRDDRAIAAAIKATTAATDALAKHGERDEKSAYGKLVPNKLETLLEAAKGAAKSGAVLSTEQRYALSSGMLALLDADHYALRRFKGGDDYGGFGSPALHRPKIPKASTRGRKKPARP